MLGGEIVDTPRDASVLVADRIRRTVKFLCAVGLGIPIVTVDWLVKSQITGSFQSKFHSRQAEDSPVNLSPF